MRFRDAARYFRSPLLPDGELLTAEFHRQRFSPHWHESFVIPVIAAGAQGYRYRGAQHIAPAGTIAAINPGEVHTGERASAQGWAYRVFYPAPAWVHGVAADLAGGRPVPAPWFADQVIDDPAVAARLIEAHRLLDAPDPSRADALAAETALHGAFALLLVRHSRGRVQQETPPPDAARVAAMQSRLAGDLTGPLALRDLAAAVGLSPWYACRLFSRTVGMPPHAWRNQLRIHRGLALLRAGAPVTETATAVGFADQSHFTRLFRRVYGVAPGRWQSSPGRTRSFKRTPARRG